MMISLVQGWGGSGGGGFLAGYWEWGGWEWGEGVERGSGGGGSRVFLGGLLG